MSTPGFWGSLGSSLEQQLAQKSPIGAALYQAETGKSPWQNGYTQNQGSPNITPPLIGLLSGIYSRKQQAASNQNQTSTSPSTAQPKQQATPGFSPVAPPSNVNPSQPSGASSAVQQPKLNPVTGYPSEQQDLNAGLIGFQSPSSQSSLAGAAIAGAYSGSNPSTPNGNPTYSNTGWNTPSSTSGDSSDNSNGTVPSSSETITYDGSQPVDLGGGSVDNQDPSMGFNIALGGVMGSPTIARVSESGPESVGGKVVTQPSIVKLNKGEAVVPLTPRPNNKLQPDLLEGHLAAPKVPMVNYSRYKSYGQGKGLMR